MTYGARMHNLALMRLVSVDAGVTIDIDAAPTRSSGQYAGRRRPHWLAAAAFALLGILVGLALPDPLTPALPPPIVVELRIEGLGVGQLARVWDARGSLDVPTWGWTDDYDRPRAAVYSVQAGEDGPASCSILVDGTEVAHATAPPLTSVTCWWAA